MAANIGFHQTECWLFLSSRATFNACHLQLLRYRTIFFVFPTIYVCSRHGREVSSHVMESCSIKGLQKPCSFLVHVLVGAGRPFWNLFHLQAMRDQNVSFILGHTEQSDSLGWRWSSWSDDLGVTYRVCGVHYINTDIWTQIVLSQASNITCSC
jgi:hypothetical protein